MKTNPLVHCSFKPQSSKALSQAFTFEHVSTSVDFSGTAHMPSTCVSSLVNQGLCSNLTHFYDISSSPDQGHT